MMGNVGPEGTWSLEAGPGWQGLGWQAPRWQAPGCLTSVTLCVSKAASEFPSGGGFLPISASYLKLYEDAREGSCPP